MVVFLCLTLIKIYRVFQKNLVMVQVLKSIDLFIFREIIIIDLLISDLLMINYNSYNKLFDMRHICKVVLVQLCTSPCHCLLILRKGLP